jgi:hypothetical protein
LTKKFELYDYLFFLFLIVNVYPLSNFFAAGFIYNFSSLIHIVLFCILIIYKFDFKDFFRFKFPKLNIIYFETFLMLIVFAISSYYINSSVNFKPYAFFKLFSFPIIFYLFFAFFPDRFYKNDELFEKVLSVLLYFGVIHAFLSFVILYSGFVENELYVGYAVGIFHNPNSTSFLYTIIVPILFYKFTAKKIKTVTFIVLLLILSYSLLFTFSRAGYISFFIIIMLFSYSKSKATFFVMLFLSVALIFLVFLNFAFTKTDTSFSRALLYYASIKMILNDTTHFLWGYGVEEAIKIFINEKINYGSFESVISTHNFILQLAIQFGVLLPILFLLFVINVNIRILKVKKKLSPEKILLINYCLISSIALFIQNMVEDTLAHPEFFIMPIFLFFIGYLYRGWNEIKLNT